MTRSFVLPAAGNGTPQSTNRKRLMAEAMMAQSMGYEPIASPWQGANKLAQALMGGLIGMRADKMDAQGREGANNALIRALTGGKTVHQGDDPTGAMVQGINDPYQSDIGQRMLYDKWQQDNAPPAPPEYREVGGRLVQINPDGTVKEAYVPPQAPPDPMEAVRLEQEKLKLEQMRNPPPAKPAIEDPMKISKDFQSQPGMERIKQVEPIIESMYRSLQDTSAMADMDFVYGLAKILDPTSVVRESEGRMVIDAQGIGPQLLGTLNKIASGEQAMLPEIRQKLFGVAIRRAEELQQQAQTERGFYSKMATENQINPETYLQQVPGLPKWEQQGMQRPASAPQAPSPVTQPVPSPVLGAVGSTTTGPGKGDMQAPPGWEQEWPYLSEAERQQVLMQGQ